MVGSRIRASACLTGSTTSHGMEGMETVSGIITWPSSRYTWITSPWEGGREGGSQVSFGLKPTSTVSLSPTNSDHQLFPLPENQASDGLKSPALPFPFPSLPPPPATNHHHDGSPVPPSPSPPLHQPITMTMDGLTHQFILHSLPMRRMDAHEVSGGQLDTVQQHLRNYRHQRVSTRREEVVTSRNALGVRGDIPPPSV